MTKVHKLAISILITTSLLIGASLPSVTQAKTDPEGNIVIEEQDIRTLQKDQQNKDEETQRNMLIVVGIAVAAAVIAGLVYKSQRKTVKPKHKKSGLNK